jgi:hypothetical protein
MKQLKRSILLACGLCVAAITPAHAQTRAGGNYAVMSLIGDTLTVTPYNGVLAGNKGPGIGRRVDTREYLDPPAPPGLDQLAADTIATAVGRLSNGKPQMLSARHDSLIKLQDKLFDGSDASRQAREALLAVLKERNADYLILVSKRRTERAEMLPDNHALAAANLRIIRGSSADTVRLLGLGLYLDDQVRVQRQLTPFDYSGGVLVAYVNATVRLIDAKTLNVIREVPAIASEIVAIAPPLEVGFNAWDEASEEQKTDALKRLIGVAMSEAAAKLLN